MDYGMYKGPVPEIEHFEEVVSLLAVNKVRVL